MPQEEDFDQWASWFNDQKITQFLEQGKYPNTPNQQKEFYQNSLEQGRFLTLVKTKDGELLDVVSLSDINLDKKTCQVAYVCPVKSDKARIAPLEALALATEHAFNRFGVTQVWAGHAYPGLKGWVQKTEILGYKTDEVTPTGFRHGMTVSDAVRTSITKKSLLALVERRKGHSWPGEIKAKKMMTAIRGTKSLAEQVDESVKRLNLQHDEMMSRIELDAQI